MAEVDVERFNLKLKESLRDIIVITSRVKKKSDLYFTQLTDKDNISEIEAVGLNIADLLNELRENAISIIDDLKTNIIEINKDQTENIFKELLLKLVSSNPRDIQKCDKGTNTEHLLNNFLEMSALSPVENKIAPDASINLSLTLKRDRRSETPETDDAWNDTLKRSNPNDVFVNQHKKEEVFTDSSDDSDDFDKVTVNLNSPPDPNAIDSSEEIVSAVYASDHDEKTNVKLEESDKETLRAESGTLDNIDEPSTEDIEAVLAGEDESSEPNDVLPTSQKEKRLSGNAENAENINLGEMDKGTLRAEAQNSEPKNVLPESQKEKLHNGNAENSGLPNQEMVPLKPVEMSDNLGSDVNTGDTPTINNSDATENEPTINNYIDDVGPSGSEKTQEHSFSEEWDSDHTYCKSTQQIFSPIPDKKEKETENKICSPYSASTEDSNEDNDPDKNDTEHVIKTTGGDQTLIESELKNVCDKEKCDVTCEPSCVGPVDTSNDKDLDSDDDKTDIENDSENAPSTPNILEKDLKTPSHYSTNELENNLKLTPSESNASGLGASQNPEIIEKDLFLSQNQSDTVAIKQVSKNHNEDFANDFEDLKDDISLSQCSTSSNVSYVFDLDETKKNIGLVNSETSNKSDDNFKDIVETEDAVNDSSGENGESNDFSDGDNVITSDLEVEKLPELVNSEISNKPNDNTDNILEAKDAIEDSNENNNHGSNRDSDAFSDADTVIASDLEKEEATETSKIPQEALVQSSGEKTMASENDKVLSEHVKETQNVEMTSISERKSAESSKQNIEETAISEGDLELAEGTLVDKFTVSNSDNMVSNENAKEVTSESESLDKKSETKSECDKESDGLLEKGINENSVETGIDECKDSSTLGDNSVLPVLKEKMIISESDNEDNTDSGNDNQKSELLNPEEACKDNSDDQQYSDIADELLALLSEEKVRDKKPNKKKLKRANTDTVADSTLSDEEKAKRICELWNSSDVFSDSDSESYSTSNSDEMDVSISDSDSVEEIITGEEKKEELDDEYYKELLKKHNFAQCFIRVERMWNNKDNVYKNKFAYDSDDRLCNLSNLNSKRKHDSDGSLHTPKKIKRKKKSQQTKSVISSSDSSNLDDSDIEMARPSSSDIKLHSDLEQQLDDILAQNCCNELENSKSENSDDDIDALEEKKKEENSAGKLNHLEQDKEENENLQSLNAKKEEENCEEKPTNQELQKKSWRNDPLLRGNLNSDSESDKEVITYKSSTKKRRKRRISSDKDIILITEISDSDTDSDNKVEENKVMLEDIIISPIKRNIPISDSSDSDSDIEFISQKNRTPLKDNEDRPSPSQKGGRRNIRALVSDECLTEATQKAIREEQERMDRLEEQQKRFDNWSKSQSLSLMSSQNQEEAQGHVEPLVLDIDHLGQPLVTVHPKLVSLLKPHQREGVKFMWESCYESIERLKTDNGTGCILAHCMGLGKTLQVITLIHTLFACKTTNTKHVLVVCPLSTVNNWKKEVKWAFKDIPKEEFEVFTIYTKKDNKFDIVSKWYHLKKRVVLVMGYECFETLTNENKLMNVDENLSKRTLEALRDPGPDLIICDEGHLLRNKKALKTQALNRVKTNRRIVLTGTPLQNNLTEYYHMVNFVKPNIMGNYKEYQTNFVNPITNGQYEDSTKDDIRLMKARTHVLHKILGKTIHRIEDTELLKYLPKMIDFTLFIQLHQTQIDLYNHYCTLIEQNWKKTPKTANVTHKGGTFFSDFVVFQYIGTHPHLLALNEKIIKRREQDLIVNEIDNNPANIRSPTYLGDGWWKTLTPKDVAQKVEYGSKLRVLIGIIEECEALNDKLLVFSERLNELDVIEHFLKTIGTTKCSSWKKQQDYYRMDGTVPSEIRSDICDKFNNPNNTKARVLLMSTKVGGLGLNLTAANRVVIMTVNWNPSYDIQSIFRVYRFGQTKEVFVYRLVSLGSMEEKVYQRQVTKLAIAHRVVDRHQISRHYKSMDLQELYSCRPSADEERPTPNVPEDQMLANLILKLPCIFKYHEHRALLANRPEDNLNETELAAAWDEFKNQQQRQQQLQQQQQQLQQQQQQRVAGPVMTPIFPQSNIVPTKSAGTTQNGPNFSDAFQVGRLHLNQVATALQNWNNTTSKNPTIEPPKHYFSPKANIGNNSVQAEPQPPRNFNKPPAQNLKSQIPQNSSDELPIAKKNQETLPASNKSLAAKLEFSTAQLQQFLPHGTVIMVEDTVNDKEPPGNKSNQVDPLYATSKEKIAISAEVPPPLVKISTKVPVRLTTSKTGQKENLKKNNKGFNNIVPSTNTVIRRRFDPNISNATMPNLVPTTATTLKINNPRSVPHKTNFSVSQVPNKKKSINPMKNQVDSLYATSKEKIAISAEAPPPLVKISTKVPIPLTTSKTGQKENFKTNNKGLSNVVPITNTVIRRQFDPNISNATNLVPTTATTLKINNPRSVLHKTNFSVSRVPNKKKFINPVNLVIKKRKIEYLTKNDNGRRPSVNPVNKIDFLKPSKSTSDPLSQELIKNLGKGGVSIARIMKENNKVKNPVGLVRKKKSPPIRNSSIVWDHSYSRRKFYRDYY